MLNYCMTKTFISCIIALFAANLCLAGDADSTISISAATNSYQFVFNAKTSQPEVKQKKVTNYLSDSFSNTIPIAELYNNNFTITNVDARVDGKSIKGFEPKYGYYGGEDVFYSDEHICYFPLTISKKGGTATVTFEETINDARYFTNVFFSEAYAVTRKEVSIKIPRWMKVELKEYNFAGFDIKKSTQYIAGDDADLVTYTIQKLPAEKHEANSPGPTYLYPHLLVMSKSASVGGQNFTYFNTTADQYAWYRNLAKNGVKDKAAITAKAKEITQGAATDLDKIKAIYYYVQDNIRYIAFEDGMAGFKPDVADEVLRKKYGDCKGMANLTKELLVAAGFDAKLCWLGTHHIAYDYSTPSLAVDNHMICALNYQNKLYFLDATESFIGFNEYAERIQGRQVMIENGETFLLKNVPPVAPSQNTHTETARLTINGSSFTGTVNHLWKGEDKEDVLSGLSSVKKDKAETAMTNFLSAGDPGYVISNIKMSGTSPDKDLSTGYQVSYKTGLSSFGKEYYIDLDVKKEMSDAAIKTEERKHDLWFSHKMNLSVDNELAMPAGYKTGSLPAALNIVTPDYEFHVQYVDAPGKLTYKKNILIKNTHLPKAKFEQWNKDIEQLNKTYNESVTLKPISE